MSDYSKAEEGRAAFNAMIHCFETTNATMKALGSQYERVALSLEKQVAQQRELMDQQRMLMEYMASLQGQMAVLGEVIARDTGVLPQLPDGSAILQGLIRQGIQHLGR